MSPCDLSTRTQHGSWRNAWDSSPFASLRCCCSRLTVASIIFSSARALGSQRLRHTRPRLLERRRSSRRSGRRVIDALTPVSPAMIDVAIIQTALASMDAAIHLLPSARRSSLSQVESTHGSSVPASRCFRRCRRSMILRSFQHGIAFLLRGRSERTEKRTRQVKCPLATGEPLAWSASARLRQTHHSQQRKLGLSFRIRIAPLCCFLRRVGGGPSEPARGGEAVDDDGLAGADSLEAGPLAARSISGSGS